MVIRKLTSVSDNENMEKLRCEKKIVDKIVIIICGNRNLQEHSDILRSTSRRSVLQISILKLRPRSERTNCQEEDE